MEQSSIATMASNFFSLTDLQWMTRNNEPTDSKGYQRACNLFAAGKYDMAVKEFSHLKKTDSTSAVIYGYIMAAIAAGKNDIENELQKLETCAAYFYLRGIMQEQQGLYVEAMENYQQTITMESDFVPAMFRLAYLCDLRGDEAYAVELYENARQYRNYTNILINLGTLYEDKQQYHKAIDCYKKVLENEPQHMRAKLFLKDAYASLFMYLDEDKEREHNKLAQILSTPISDFELSVRSRNCLNKMKIKTLGDLIEKSETELLSYKNFGETSLAEIKDILNKKGLKLGMEVEEKNSPQKKDKDSSSESTNDNQELLETSISNLELSVRSRKCLSGLNIKTIGDLIQKSEHELLTCKNFGQTSLLEVKKKLTEHGFSLPQE